MTLSTDQICNRCEEEQGPFETVFCDGCGQILCTEFCFEEHLRESKHCEELRHD